jgi:hypothetical protein
MTHREMIEPLTTLIACPMSMQDRAAPLQSGAPDNPNVIFNHLRRMLWSTVSKAALTSKRASKVSFDLSVADIDVE